MPLEGGGMAIVHGLGSNDTWPYYKGKAATGSQQPFRVALPPFAASDGMYLMVAFTRAHITSNQI